MKRFTAIAALIIFVAAAGHSQNLKFGHINSDELIQAMPEFDSATANLEKFRKELVNALELMTVELNNKNDAYTKESKNLTDIVKQTKEQELIDLNRRIQDFQQNAQTQLQNKYFGVEGELFKKRQELVKPVQDEILKAIKDIAVEGSYAVIFDSSTGGNILFANPKFDISDQVLEKLGYKN